MAKGERKMSLITNYEEIKKQLSPDITLVVVSKTQPADRIQQLYSAGHRDFGENRVHELLNKQRLLPEDIRWHFIGHLQRNKIKQILPYVHLIHSIDSLRLLAEVDKEAAKINRIIDCLLQFHIANEDTKYGFSPKEAGTLFSSSEINQMPYVRICGVMGMATFTTRKDVVTREFKLLAGIFTQLKQTFFVHDSAFSHCSMGMTSDFREAIREGSTMVRIGSAIFGERNDYQQEKIILTP